MLVLSSDLNIGVMNECFQTVGTKPSSNDLLKSISKGVRTEWQTMNDRCYSRCQPESPFSSLGKRPHSLAEQVHLESQQLLDSDFDWKLPPVTQPRLSGLIVIY